MVVFVLNSCRRRRGVAIVVVVAAVIVLAVAIRHRRDNCHPLALCECECWDASTKRVMLQCIYLTPNPVVLWCCRPCHRRRRFVRRCRRGCHRRHRGWVGRRGVRWWIGRQAVAVALSNLILLV